MLGPDASVLIFGAHAADYCFRAGGTAIRYLQAGARVKVVSATFGERGESAPRWKEPGATIESVKAIRRSEAEAAARTLGVEIEFLDLDDNPLVIDQERMQLYIDQLRDFKPDIILTHWTYEPTNRDHQTVAETVIRATGLARAQATMAGEALPRAKIFHFEPDILSQPILGYVPDTYIDIGPVVEQKYEALRCFEVSQPGLLDRWPPHTEARGVEASGIGGLAGCTHAESFRRFQPYAGDYFV
ncbi:MAG: PIG-L family deacetylase [Chloroflexi bacterium]|nr:PIG-L family deacetylase [Chloroflexota bacterium]